MNKTEMLNYLASKTDDWRDVFSLVNSVKCDARVGGWYSMDIKDKGRIACFLFCGSETIGQSDFESHVCIKTTHYTDSIGKEFRRREYANGKVWWQVRQSRHDDWMMVSGDPSTYIKLEEV